MDIKLFIHLYVAMKHNIGRNEVAKVSHTQDSSIKNTNGAGERSMRPVTELATGHQGQYY